MSALTQYGPRPRAEIIRIMEKVALGASGCWLFGGALTRGYGVVRIGSVADNTRRMKYAHVIVYEALVGPIPEGLELDHLCRVKRCVNPEHLQAVTHRDNLMRGDGPAAANAAKTHCVNGHVLTLENIYPSRGRTRVCRICHRERV